MSRKKKDIRHLTGLEREVTQNCGTEPPFNNAYWDNKKEGIYVDILSGEPLFSSIDKYDSGSGWPSFIKPLNSTEIEEKTDKSHGLDRTEVRSKTSDSHLGHVFDDGPGPYFKRYCINSAALRFIPKEELVEEGYGEYLVLFGAHVAYFAGGCFWCTEADFLKVKGVLHVVSGYMGGDKENPTYEEVCSGVTGHAESIQVIFDPSLVSYKELVHLFWHSIDPTTKDRQFCDIGSQYRTAIFYVDENQKAEALLSLGELKKKHPDLTVVTEITRAERFYPAEEYHQKFFEREPEHYRSYRNASGRDERLKQLYSKKN